MIWRRKDILKQHATLIKRSLVFANIVGMLWAIQTYVNYTAILEQTLLVEQQTQKVRDEISYFNNFQLKFLNSPRSAKILAHENGVFAYNEAPIVFKEKLEAQPLELQPAQQLPLSPWQERKQFFAEKLPSEE